MHAPGVALAAGLVLIGEGAALAVIAMIELFGLSSGDASSVVTGIALVVLTLIGAAALIAFGLGVRTGRSWARSGGVVVQVLGIALALAALTVQPVPWTFVVAVGAPAALALALLLTTARREGRGERAAAETPDAG